MNLVERTDLRLQHEESALLKEFEEWSNNSRPNTSFAKNNSQILRITAEIKSYLEASETPDQTQQNTLKHQKARVAELLYASYIWAYFRDKFAQRQVTWIKPILSCTDEFAWECYMPARNCAETAGTIKETDLKEPPLTFFDSDATPYMRARQGLFIAGGVPNLRKYFTELNAALRELPVPLVGLPWLQMGHLPAVVSIAHEVGHVVDHDFDLGATYQEAISQLQLTSDKGAWKNWCSELFADVYGCLCAGPAHLLALIDYLVEPEESVNNEAVNAADSYPPRKLRVAFNLAVLHRLGLPDEGAGLLWEGTYTEPPAAVQAPFYADVPKVVDALLDTKLPKMGGKSITEVTAMTLTEWNKVGEKAAALLQKREPLISDWKEQGLFGQWFSAAALAYYRNPQEYASQLAGYRLMQKLPKAITGTTRDATQFVEPEKQLAERINKQATGSILKRHFVDLLAVGEDKD